MLMMWHSHCPGTCPRYSALLRTQELFQFSGIPPEQGQLWFGGSACACQH
jgi:hypothetical protein